MSTSIEQVLLVDEHDTIIAHPGEPIVNISAADARRKVNETVGGEISLLMRALEPALVHSAGLLVWRVVIEFATPSQGHLGYIGVLDVNARTGELITPTNFAKEIEANARALLNRSSHPAKV